MRTIIFKPFIETNHNSFVYFWKNYYDEKYIPLYDKLIKVKTWKPEHIRELFEWKNNMKDKLTSKKEKFVSRVTDNITLVNRLRMNFDKDKFLKAFGSLGPIWGITLLHTLHPAKYPIFDQHVYRAYNFIIGNQLTKMPVKNKIYHVYFYEYVPFFHKFYKSITSFNRKEADNALWAFGKFLASYGEMAQ